MAPVTVSEERGPGDACCPSAPPPLGDSEAAGGEAKQENGEWCPQQQQQEVAAPLALPEGAGEPLFLTAIDTMPGSPPEKKEEEEHPRQQQQQQEGEVALEPPEGGWGWVVMLASMWCNGAVFGIQNSCGVLFKSMLTEFGNPEDKQLIFRTDMGTKAEKAICPRLSLKYVMEM